MLRPGRIDKAVKCNFPGLEDRKQIIEVYLKKFSFAEKLSEQELEQFLRDLAAKTVLFTSADIKGLIQNAQLNKMSEHI